MGLFKKSSPAEKKLKQLTGGFLLSNGFMNLLKERNLEIKDGTNIQNQLKEEIKQGLVNETNLEARLNYLIDELSGSSPVDVKLCPECGETQDEDNTFCIHCGYEFKSKQIDSSEITCPKCNKAQDASNKFCIDCGYDFSNLISKHADFIRKTKFLNNYNFNLKTCPECNTKFLKIDPFCFNCGASVISPETVKNNHFKVKDGKFVKQESKQNDELSNLEALYSQTVKSKYAPIFKVGYVLYLDMFNKNPSKKTVEGLAKKHDTTPDKLKKQALEDGFIETAPAISEARNSKVADLKEILKENSLKVSGKKDELIERLAENLSEDELKKYFKSKNYQLSAEGLDFLAKNLPILYIYKDKELSRAFISFGYAMIFEEKIYSCDEIYDILIKYLISLLDENLTKDKWLDFKSYSNGLAKVHQDKGNLKDALNTRFKVFIFDINNYSIYSDKPEPRNTRLKKKDMVNIVNLMHELTLPIEELKELFEKSYNEILFKSVITSQDAFVYLLKIFGGEDLDEISKEINESYSNPY